MLELLAQQSSPIEGSELWRALFIVAAAALIAWQVWRGWRLGLPRTLAGALAILAAYVAATILGPALLPVLRPMVRLPDFAISAVGAVGIGFITYGFVSIIAMTAFKRTKDQKNPIMHFVYGASGAVVGLLVGVVLVWFLVIALRFLGTIAESRYAAVGDSFSSADEETPPPPPVAHFVAKLKKSVEMGPGAVVIGVIDPVPEEVYRVVRKISLLIQTPGGAERFLNYPGARELVTHPKIVKLSKDPTIQQLVAKRDFMALLQNEGLIQAANDPQLAEKIKAFPLEKALDYSLGPAREPQQRELKPKPAARI